ncbi:SRPBCC family protein [Gordonia sp. UCD-TK1]|uniref:SRPBCC family protein n=1 Tax=Gordonia sp. UCD-TK1 TaxID=1857893 RepID=UPI00080E553A|nr:SRPBCC family protein [Gordonia sp. UCD-TK1]OCH79903.1 polyketide cyclase [Gordonia sp. UCD-TK1]
MLSPARVTVIDTVVSFDAPIEVTFDYLADPTNRPEWQSSLRRIDDLRPIGDRAGDVGTSWTDVTVVPGVSPRMEVTACESPRRWQEIGRWRSVDAVLTLTFADRDGADRKGGTDVHAEAVLTVPAIGGLVLTATRWPAAQAVRADLERAARLLAGRGSR